MIVKKKTKLFGRIKVQWGIKLGTRGLRKLEWRFLEINILPKEEVDEETPEFEEEAPAEEVGGLNNPLP